MKQNVSQLIKLNNMNMEKNDRCYLSPRQILSYLRDFENKLPTPPEKNYVPTLKTSVISNEDINAEVNRMLKHLRMNGYTAKCKWADLNGSVGGLIKLDGSKTLDITLNKTWRNNAAAAVAILAHEICHKYLQIHGIYIPDITIVNEIYTDLCTIYVGFGDCILKGYHTVTGTSILGYLQSEIYKDVSILIDVVAKGKSLPAEEKSGQGTWDIWLWEGLKYWVSNEDKHQLNRDIFMQSFTQISDYKRTEATFRSLLQQVDDFLVNRAELIDQRVLNGVYIDKEESKQKFACFSEIYEGVLLANDSDIPELTASNEALKHAIVQISKALGHERLNNRRISIEHFECPHCHHTASTSVLSEKHAIVKCSKCKHMFAVNAESFDLKEAVDSLNRYKTELEKPIRQQCDSRLKAIRQQCDSRLKAIRQEGYVEGFTDAKKDGPKSSTPCKKKLTLFPVGSNGSSVTASTNTLNGFSAK